MARRNGIGSHNPFDSDDEEANRHRTSTSREKKYSNPFDEDGHGVSGSSPAKTTSTSLEKKYTNPFDDGRGVSGSSPAKKPVAKHVQFQSSRRRVEIPDVQTRNPFSGGEEEDEPAAGKNNNPRDSKSRLNEDTGHSYEGLSANKGENFISNVKQRAASVGESAVRTAEKVKVTGAHQARKIRIRKSGGSSSRNSGKEIPNSSSSSFDNSNNVLPNSSSQERKELLSGFEVKDTSSSSSSLMRKSYKNDFRDSGGFDNQSVQELESYAVYKSEETTTTVNNCLKLAENIKEDATKTLITLHQQGEQITRTHNVAADIDYNLKAGEKLLGNLGGIFSRKWKPERTRAITGPVLTRDDSFKRRGKHMEQRAALGLVKSPKGRSSSRTYPLVADTPQVRIEVEKTKQDDALLDLSNVLDQLKEMAVDMGSEIERQNHALDPLADDVTELGYRVKGANARGRRLLGK